VEPAQGLEGLDALLDASFLDRFGSAVRSFLARRYDAPAARLGECDDEEECLSDEEDEGNGCGDNVDVEFDAKRIEGRGERTRRKVCADRRADAEANCKGYADVG
jgi:hypothetical protein